MFARRASLCCQFRRQNVLGQATAELSRLFSSKDHLSDDPVDFGFTTVSRDEKTKLVSDVFTNVASSYDVMNDLMSAGLHRIWKNRFVDKLRPFPTMQHLDVAGGTGDIAFRVLDGMGRPSPRAAPLSPQGRVTVCDLNESMLQEGQRRAKAMGYEGPSLRWVVGNAERLPIGDASMDSYTIAFGIRNVTDKDAALREAHRVLRPGGRLMVLEFSHVTVPGLQQLYDAYSFGVIPALGQAVANDRASYQYLVESIRRFPRQEEFSEMIASAGFRSVSYENLTAGVVAIHTGFKL